MINYRHPGNKTLIYSLDCYIWFCFCWPEIITPWYLSTCKAINMFYSPKQITIAVQTKMKFYWSISIFYLIYNIFYWVFSDQHTDPLVCHILRPDPQRQSFTSPVLHHYWACSFILWNPTPLFSLFLLFLALRKCPKSRLQCSSSTGQRTRWSTSPTALLCSSAAPRLWSLSGWRERDTTTLNCTASIWTVYAAS